MSRFDAAAIEVDKPARMTILHPDTGMPVKDGEDREAYIEGYSNDSDVAERGRRALTTARLRQRNRNAVTADRLAEEGVELLASLTTGWHLVGLNGSVIEVPHSIDAAKELFADRRLSYIKEQWDEFTSTRANFPKASSKT